MSDPFSFETELPGGVLLKDDRRGSRPAQLIVFFTCRDDLASGLMPGGFDHSITLTARRPQTNHDPGEDLPLMHAER